MDFERIKAGMSSSLPEPNREDPNWKKQYFRWIEENKHNKQIIESLEAGLVPSISILNNSSSSNEAQEWEKNDELSEELLIHIFSKEPRNIKDDILFMIEERFDKQGQFFAKKFAELVDYDEYLCNPILEGDPAFVSKMEDASVTDLGMMLKISEYIKELKGTLENLTKVLEKITENDQNK